MLYVEIEADMNDADYIAKISMLPNEDLEDLKEAIKHIQAFKKAYPWEENFPTGEMDSTLSTEFYKKQGMTEKQFELLNDLTPGCGDYPTHSIKSITVYTVTNVETLL